jgi:microsomal dipeptidase-like Zn-dependent dipeptidase
MPAVFAELARRGWPDERLRKLSRGNFLRVWRAVERAAGGNGAAGERRER